MRTNYPAQGGAWCAKQLGMLAKVIREKANRLKIPLTKETRRRIVYGPGAEYMRQHNPSHLPGASERLSKNAKSRPDALQKLMEGHARLRKDNPSGLEQKLCTMLDALGVTYDCQALIKPKFIVDIMIGNLIIEADGDWWHGHLRFAPLSERQLKQQSRDKARNKYLAACGYKVERIWESDMSIQTVTAILQKHHVID